MASKKRKPGIGRVSKKRTVRSYVGPDVAKAMEAVGIPAEVEVDGTAAALSAISGQLALLVAAAEKLVAKANEPAPERKPRKTKAEVAADLMNAERDEMGERPSERAMRLAAEKKKAAATPGTVEEKPLPPPPTLDELRAAAVAYAGKHGKEQLVALLQKYNPEGKLSTVPPENLSACLAALKMGMVD